MARALAKADAEMRAGSWVVSLEFEAVGRPPHARMDMPSGRPIWIYRIGAMIRGPVTISPRETAPRSAFCARIPAISSRLAPSRRAPDASIKPHGSHAKRAPPRTKQLEAYPKCS